MANLSTQNIGTNYKGMLNLGSTINTPLSTTLQAITDGDGVASPLNLATDRVTLTPPSLTGSTALSALSITQTWNTTGNPTAIFANITNTASGATANLMDLQIGGATIFKVDKNAIITTGASNLGFIHNGTVTFTTASSQHIRSNSSGTNIGTGGLVASARLSVESTTQGFLPPRMTTTQVNAIATPAEGLVVFNTTISHLCVYLSGAWVKLSHSPM